MDHNMSETNSSDKDFQNLDKINTDQNINERQTQQKSAQESGHYWWCPTFGHLQSCHYLNHGFQESIYWNSMSNSWSNPQIPNIHQNSKPTLTRRLTNSPKMSPKEVYIKEIERMYSCRLCDQLNETQDMTTLRKHIEDHLGRVRPFVCAVCGKVFKFKSNCRNHLIAHSVVRKNIRCITTPTHY